MNVNLATAQKALIEKDTLLQEAVLNNTHLAKQIPETSSESEVIEGAWSQSNLSDDSNHSTISPIITSGSGKTLISNEKFGSFFFQLVIFLIILLLIIYFLWSIFSHLYSFISLYNEEKNLLNYKIPLNRNQGYAFGISNPIRRRTKRQNCLL